MNLWYKIYFCLLIFCFFFGFFNLKYLQRSNKLILLLLFFTITVEILAFFLGNKNINNVWLYHLFMPIELILFLSSFNYLKNKSISIVLGIISITLMFLNSIFFQPFLGSFPSHGFVILCVNITFISIHYFYNLLMVGDTFYFRSSKFWVAIGFLIFSILNLFLLGTFDFLVKNFDSLETVLSSIRFLSNYLLYSFIIFSFYISIKYEFPK